jgi:hypothetical protein
VRSSLCPALVQDQGYTTTHLSAGKPVRRSWHLFEGVSFGGCPGFKGPDPQPVSMSVGKSRVPSRERQGWLDLAARAGAPDESVDRPALRTP